MKLTYRGQTYTPSSDKITTIPCMTYLTYRGQSYLRQVSPSPIVSSKPNLVYRGVSYNSYPSSILEKLTQVFN